MSNAPLLILLHGLGDSSEFISNFFHIQGPASDKGVILIIPNGLKDLSGQRFWNAPGVCCDFYGSGTDDMAYILGLIDI